MFRVKVEFAASVFVSDWVFGADIRHPAKPKGWVRVQRLLMVALVYTAPAAEPTLSDAAEFTYRFCVFDVHVSPARLLCEFSEAALSDDAHKKAKLISEDSVSLFYISGITLHLD